MYSSFQIEYNNTSLEYKISTPPESYVKWAGWGLWSKRMVYTQLNPDGKIWLLDGKTKNPITKFIAQPEGFPLEPNT